MKNYIKLSIFSLTLAGITACEMDAPNQSALEPDVIGFTEKLAESAIMSIHQSFGETNSYRGRYLPYYGVNSDVETTSGSYPSLSKKNDDKIQTSSVYYISCHRSGFNLIQYLLYSRSQSSYPCFPFYGAG